MKHFLAYILLFLFLLISFCGLAQERLFEDISQFDSVSANPKLLYFHFEGCPPCKKMDDQVLSKGKIQSYLQDSFDLYSVYNFGEYEKKIRKRYGNRTNPEFIVLDSMNVVNHRFAGYHDAVEFLKQLDFAFSSRSLSELERKFAKKEKSLFFFRQYMLTKEAIRHVDSSLALEYLDFLLLQPISEQIIKDVAHYGYLGGKIWIEYGTKYYRFLEKVYYSDNFSEYDKYLRPRLLISLILYYDQEARPKDKNALIRKIESLENGNMNVIWGIRNDAMYSILTEKYPSFDIKYEQNNSREERLSLLKSHIKKLGDDHQELNSLAWGIYTGKYDYSIDQGLELIEKAIELKKLYNYLDTHAALLYKSGDYSRAREQANAAIKIAKSSSIDYETTTELLAKINRGQEKEQD